MKKIHFVLVALVLSCIGFAQNTVSFQAEIANRNGDIIYIKNNMNKVIREIKVNDKGVFKSTFEIKDDFYILYDGVEYAQLFLKGGFDLQLKMDAKEFDESIAFTGKGADENNLLAYNSISNEVFLEQNLEKDKDAFYAAFEVKKKSDLEKLEKGSFDVVFKEKTKKDMMNSFLGLQMEYKQAQAMKQVSGKPAPTFDYVNFAGGKTKLDELKGKYVYIDVWATWCGPCRAEIPFLKKVEEKYHDKNITFVSISVDVQKDFEKWKTFVKDKSLGGIQLFADKDWSSDFITAFGINSIPRFILIDPSGNVVNPNAERPSDPKLQTILDSLLK